MQYRHVLKTLSNSVIHHSAQSQKTLYPLRLCSRPRMLKSSLLPISLQYKQIDNLPSAGWLPLVRNVRYSKAYKIYLYTPCMDGSYEHSCETCLHGAPHFIRHQRPKSMWNTAVGVKNCKQLFSLRVAFMTQNSNTCSGDDVRRMCCYFLGCEWVWVGWWKKVVYSFRYRLGPGK